MGILGVYSKPDCDPRFHTVTVVFVANGSSVNMKANDDAKEIDIFSYNEINNMELAFDHNSILADFFNSKYFTI